MRESRESLNIPELDAIAALLDEVQSNPVCQSPQSPPPHLIEPSRVPSVEESTQSTERPVESAEVLTAEAPSTEQTTHSPESSRESHSPIPEEGKPSQMALDEPSSSIKEKTQTKLDSTAKKKARLGWIRLHELAEHMNWDGDPAKAEEFQTFLLTVEETSAPGSSEPHSLEEVRQRVAWGD